ncbi:hypothetical protein PHLCEN_2v10831 [Hermanssonia centrifuga]|uniref:Uncharacterized protein n=1 Tax=Hermanssonia centrifuga TaxID=98765 RepID=A0A2R6NLS0_9APHY|nr:hypothetical protein PHLCEN_2v10831 [Hermanssonia centrifuga]
MRFEPWHTPFPSTETQFPFNENWPAPQIIQSLEVAPVQVWHRGEQETQAVPLLKPESGHETPFEVVGWTAKHLVRSLAFCVKPVLQEMQSPVPSAHWAVELLTVGIKQRPLPEIPSSQEEHPAGHAWQFGPKKPEAQVSQDVPLNPGGHEHVPDAEQIPAPAHGGEHADDCISRIEILLSDEPEGNCDKSGIESQRIRRSVEDGPDATAAHMLSETINDPADVEVESLEALFVGSALSPGYSAIPASSARFNGSENEDELALANPGAKASSAEEEESKTWSNCGFVLEVYCPGSNRTFVGVSDDDKTAPAMRNWISFLLQDTEEIVDVTPAIDMCLHRHIKHTTSTNKPYCWRHVHPVKLTYP